MDLKTISLSRQSHLSNINVKLTTIAFYSNYTKKYLLHLKEKTVLLLPSNLQMTVLYKVEGQFNSLKGEFNGPFPHVFVCNFCKMTKLTQKSLKL